MTKEQIKARVCELFEFGEDKWFDYEHEFMTLAAEIAATEREACAKICRERADKIAAEADRCRSEEPDEVSALCSTAWQLIVAENEILKRSNAGAVR